MRRLVSANNGYEASSEKTASGNAASFDGSAARIIEYWINVTAIGASADYDFNAQTSIQKLGSTSPSPIFLTQKTLNITATGLYVIVINRVDHALGLLNRLSWVKNTTEITFDAKTVIVE